MKNIIVAFIYLISLRILATDEESLSVSLTRAAFSPQESSLFRLDDHAFQHVLSFLPVADIVHSRTVCKKFARKEDQVKDLIAKKIDWLHKTDQRDFQTFDLRNETDQKKLISLARYFDFVTYPFLRVEIIIGGTVNRLNNECFRDVFKNVKTLHIDSGAFQEPPLKHFPQVIQHTGLSSLQGLYLSNWTLDLKDWAATLDILENLESLGVFPVEYDFYIENNPLMPILMNSRHAQSYKNLVIPTIDFGINNTPENSFKFFSTSPARGAAIFDHFKKLNLCLLQYNRVYKDKFGRPSMGLSNELAIKYAAREKNLLDILPLGEGTLYSFEFHNNFRDELFHFHKTSSDKTVYENEDKVAMVRKAIHQ